MIVTTTALIEGHPVREYKGIVTSEVIAGANLVRDIFASVTDIFGGRSGWGDCPDGRSRLGSSLKFPDCKT